MRSPASDWTCGTGPFRRSTTSIGEITEDVNEAFKQLTGLGNEAALENVWMAPFTT